MDPRSGRHESPGINLDRRDELGKHGNVTRVHLAQTERRFILNEDGKHGETGGKDAKTSK